MASNVEQMFSKLWKQYTDLNPEVQKIHDLFTASGHNVINDHIALRTFNLRKVNKETLAQPFINIGYEIKNSYNFEAKKLDAIHLEHSTDNKAPKVFISELRLEEFSSEVQAIINRIIEQMPESVIKSQAFPYSGVQWSPVSTEEHSILLTESEYAAWVSCFGYVANHFTVKVNDLNSPLDSIEHVNKFIEDAGYQINSNGGKVKGTPDVFLVQSSTNANKQTVKFSNGTKELPTCFYEFACRYPLANGQEFSGFIADNADKIFTSTNVN